MAAWFSLDTRHGIEIAQYGTGLNPCTSSVKNAPREDASRAQVETAILDHLYEQLPEIFDENEVRLLSARVLGLLMRPGGGQRLH
ncbi:MAG TPA: hypothetical protein VF811_12920 [Parasulfuritortus sp.]